MGGVTGRSVWPTDGERRRRLYYLGTMMFAAMAIVLVFAFFKKRGQRHDWPEEE